MILSFEGAVLNAPGETLKIVEVSADTLRPDDVLVRMVASGICHTDLFIQAGNAPIPMPIILGHEGSGIVERVGHDVTEFDPGDAVAMTFMSCGQCPACGADRPAHCEQFVTLNIIGRRADGSSALSRDGESVGGHFFGQSSFARYSVANRRNLVKVGTEVPLELTGPFGCGIQTGAGAIFNTLSATPGDSLAVFGGGAVGLSAIMAAKVIGCSPIILVEPHRERRALALELGATHVFEPGGDAVLEKIREATAGGAKLIVDTTGSAPVINDALQVLGKGGKFGLVGLSKASAMATFSIAGLMGQGASIHSVIEGDSDPRRFIPFLIDLFLKGKFPVDRLVQFYDFADINDAIADQRSGKVIKAILRF